jgi:hypothetical protein
VRSRRRWGEAFVLGKEQILDEEEPDLADAPGEPVKPPAEFAGTWPQAAELRVPTLVDPPRGADEAERATRTNDVDEEAGVAEAERRTGRGWAAADISNTGDGGERGVGAPTTEAAGEEELCDGQRSEQVEEAASNGRVLGADAGEEDAKGVQARGAAALRRAPSTGPLARLLMRPAVTSVLPAGAIAVASVLALHGAGGGPQRTPLKTGSEPHHPDASGDSQGPRRGDPRRREHGADQVATAPLTASTSPSPAEPPPAEPARSPLAASAPTAVPSAASSPPTAQARPSSSSAEAADRRTVGREFGQP